jgi:hypothetical protein
MSAAFRVPFTVSGAHVYMRVRRGSDFDELMHALPDVEFAGDVKRARTVLVRLQPRRRAETATQRDPAGSARARAARADALARATDSASAGDAREERMGSILI